MSKKAAVRRSAKKSAAKAAAKSFISPSAEDLGLFDPTPMRLPDPGYGNYEKYLKAYADEVWVYACVSRRAADVAATPIDLVDKASGKKVEKHDVLTLLDNPNPRMRLTRRGFIWWLEASQLLAGSGYFLGDELKGRKPSILWPLIPSMVEVVPSKDPKIFREGYKYHVGGKAIPLSTDVCHQIQFFNPLDYNYGLPPLAAGRMSADTHRASTRYNLRFFDNSARPDLVFTTPNSLTPEQRKRMFLAWMKRHRGEDKAHFPAFLEKGTEAQLIGVNQKDMDFVNQKKMSREELCSTYQTPPALVGLFEYANYANAQEQEAIYWRSTVVPDAKAICEFLNATLLPAFDPTGKLAFRVDESSIRALQEDQDKQSQYVDRYWRMGVPLNQLVKAYKLPFGEVKGIGDISFIGGQEYIEGELEDPAADPAAPPAELPAPKKAPAAPSQAQRKAKHARMLELAQTYGAPLKAAVRKVFDDQRDKVLAAVHAAGNEPPTRERLGIDTDKATRNLAEAMAPHIKLGVYAGRDAESVLLRELVKKHATPAPNRKAQARIDKWTTVKAFKWAEDINASTLKRIDKIIDDSLSEGLGMDEISRRLAEAFDSERDYRTNRVAQTEIIASLNEGALEAYRDNPFVEGKGWLATEDEVTRQSHLAAGEKYGPENPIGVDEKFIVGSAEGVAPGQTGDPSEDIECRCSIFPVVKKEANA